MGEIDLSELSNAEWQRLREAEDARRAKALQEPWVKEAYQEIRDRLVPKSYRIPDSREIETMRWIAFNLRRA